MEHQIIHVHESFGGDVLPTDALPKDVESAVLDALTNLVPGEDRPDANRYVVLSISVGAGEFAIVAKPREYKSSDVVRWAIAAVSDEFAERMKALPDSEQDEALINHLNIKGQDANLWTRRVK